MYKSKLNKVTSLDREQFGMLMAAAFIADPMARFFWSKPHQYMSVFPECTTLYQDSAINNGTSWATEDFSGAISWLEPGELPETEKVVEMIMATCNQDRQGDILRFFKEAVSYFPKDECWYLLNIGVDPAHMSKGIGTFLMEETLKVVDEHGQASYLESSNPRTVDFYQQFGFEPIARISLGGQEICTPMYRKPK